MKKRSFLAILLTLVLSINTLVFSAPANTSPSTSQTDTSAEESKKKSFPEIHAEAAFVIDPVSGTPIKELNADKKVYPAGLTNIMTAIIVLENLNLTDTCVVTKDALYGSTYNSPQLKEGEVYSVDQLLHAIILKNNNDASNVLAIAVSGSTADFVKRMNEKAEYIGMTNTNFTNPSGAHDENHYTTARDMAILAQYAMQYPVICDIADTPEFTFPPTEFRAEEVRILNDNHLVSNRTYPYHVYKYASGLKSASSTEAGNCLVAFAKKKNMTVISVVMGARNQNKNDLAYSFRDTIAVFDYVFENYKSVCLIKKGEVVYDSKVEQAKNSTRLALTVEKDVYVTMKSTADEEIITHKTEITGKAKAPIKQGQVFGTVTYYYNGDPIATENLIAANEVKRDFFLFAINAVLGFIFHPIVIIIVVLALYVFARIRIVRNRKRRLRRSRLASQKGSRNTAISSRISDRSRSSSSFDSRRSSSSSRSTGSSSTRSSSSFDSRRR